MIREAERIAKGIYDGTITTGFIDKNLTGLVAEKLREAVIEGFGKDLPEVDYNTPDFAALSHLERNVYSFSSAKNYQQLKSMTLAVKDGDRVRTFTEFRNEALKISGEYVGPWLRTEYNTAIAGSQMAAKWERFQADKDTLPLLEYRTVGDERVRPSHEALDGVIKNIDSPFWDSYYPPNGWGCRCDVIQSLYGKETEDKDIPIPDDVPKMFQSNMAKEGILFPKNHPYYIGLPDEIRRQGQRLLVKRILNWGRHFLVGKKVEVSKIGEVHFTGNAIKGILNQPHLLYMEKNQAVYALENIVKNSRYISSAPDLSGKNKAFHYLKFSIKGKDSYVVVKEPWKGNKVVYSIVDHIK